VRSVLFVGGLSFAIAVAYVVLAGLSPRGYVAAGPFANLHGGLPAGLPAYLRQVQGTRGGGSGEGTFEWSAETPDAPNTVLRFYEHNIDQKIWAITGSGEKTMSFYYRSSPGIRGGVHTLENGRTTFISLWMTDLKLPVGYPLDFPGAERVRPIGVPTNEAGVYVARWELSGMGDPSRFVTDFAQTLKDAEWEVTALTATGREPSLQCRSRSSPLITCSLRTQYEIVKPSTGGVVYDAVGRYVANVRVGRDADR
jgi:hypothetical protein